MKRKNDWNLKAKSIFKDYKRDTPDLIDECFEFDWINGKISKIIKNEEDSENLKELLKSIYP